MSITEHTELREHNKTPEAGGITGQYIKIFGGIRQ